MRNVRTQSQSTLYLDQERQIVQLAIEYGVHDCEPILTPVEPHFDIQKYSDTPLVCHFPSNNWWVPFCGLTGNRILKSCNMWSSWHDFAPGMDVLASWIYWGPWKICTRPSPRTSRLRVAKQLWGMTLLQMRGITFIQTHTGRGSLWIGSLTLEFSFCSMVIVLPGSPTNSMLLRCHLLRLRILLCMMHVRTVWTSFISSVSLCRIWHSTR